MAARRLIAILLVLLFLSSLAAALAPVQRTEKSVSTTTSSESSTTDAENPDPATLPGAAAGNMPRLIEQQVDTSREQAPTIRARVGDQLQLRVTSRTPGTVELAGIGATEDIGAAQPAFFDVILRNAGTYRVRFLDTGREIARIEVAEPPAQDQPR